MRGGRVAGMALDVPQCGECPREIEKIEAILRVRREKVLTDLDGPTVVRQPPVDLAQVDIDLTEIVEVIGEESSVVVEPACLVDGHLLFGHGLLECGERLGVLPSLVVQDTEVVPAQAELAVITRLVGLCANQDLEDVHGPPD